uniref:Uncharacterized protein n=1 Tax=viral metagenome TaxID=1070528 RepID=A0A6C0DY76_9ZZZZ
MTKMWKYAALVAVLGVFSYYHGSIKKMFTIIEPDDEYEMVKKYLLNDSPLYGFNKPKIWIHTKYELNARKWRDFYSRNTYDLNQPYIHLTIRSIINHCSNDFHICLIDDETFSKLIPTWDIQLSTVAEPLKSQYRQLGLAQLLYYYGGFVVPNSFLCSQNLKPMFERGIEGGKPFVCEAINRTTSAKTRRFIPDTYFMGAKKNDPVIEEYLTYLKTRSFNGHITNVYEFLGDVEKGCIDKINHGKMNLIGGEYIGIKTVKNKPVLIEHLMEDHFLDLPENIYGIYIPDEDLLKRTKYSWFCVLTTQQLMETNNFISHQLKASLVDSVSIYRKKPENKSMISI